MARMRVCRLGAVTGSSRRESRSCVVALFRQTYCFPKSRRGRKVTAFGVIFDYTGNAEGTTVQLVKDMVEEEWVTIIIKPFCDFFWVSINLLISLMQRLRRNQTFSCL